jgi:hypothetical protein
MLRLRLEEAAIAKAGRARLLLKPPPPNKFLKEKKHKVTRLEKQAAKALAKDAAALHSVQNVLKKVQVRVDGKAALPNFAIAFLKAMAGIALESGTELLEANEADVLAATKEVTKAVQEGAMATK